VLVTLYTRPELLSDSTIAAVRCLLRQPDVSESIPRSAGQVLQFMTLTPWAERSAAAIVDLLEEPGKSPTVYLALLDALSYVATWRRDLLHLAPLIALAERDHLAEHRERLVQTCIEPCLFYRPGDLTEPLLMRLRGLDCGRHGLAYSLAALAARGDMAPGLRAMARQAIHGRFPLAPRVRALLLQGERRILVIHKLKDAHGDEIVRVVPLVQALLDGNPELTVTLVTPRPYLYAHPRITAVWIDHIARLHEVLEEPFDAVVDAFHPMLNHGSGLERYLAQYEKQRCPSLMLSWSTCHESYTYERVQVDGEEWAEALGLNRQRLANVYETTIRLLAELGLPIRTGETPPVSQPVIAGLSCPESDAAWDTLVRGNVEGRPVAIVNPFGGHEPLKGYVRRTHPSLVRRLRGLLAEGFYLVLLPSGTPWGSAVEAAAVVQGLEPDERVHVAIAPDPHAGAEVTTCTCAGGRLLRYNSYVMRQFFSFLARADLIVTVEGWAVHVAYCLGKPYQALALPHSMPRTWLPWGTTQHQTLSLPVTPPDAGGERLLALEEQPRSYLLCAILAALGECGSSQAVEPLRRACRSEHRHVRLAALHALRSRGDMDLSPLCLDLLGDPNCEVRAVAAEALLESGVDWSVHLGPAYREQLRVHVALGASSPDWTQVPIHGRAGRAALESALHDEYSSVRRGAAQGLRRLDFYRAEVSPAPQPSLRNRLNGRLRPLRGWRAAGSRAVTRPSVLIATPLKNAEDCIDLYCRLLRELTYPHHRISLGLLESDSEDETYETMERCLPDLRRTFRRAELWKHDFAYRIPPEYERGDVVLQVERRAVLARSRNHLLARALRDEDWVLWLDVDVIAYPPDILERLLAPGKDIITPNCVLEYGGRSFDRNAWRDQALLHLDDLRGEGDIVPLHAVGATMLLVRADLHREGLIFPPFLYGKGNQLSRDGYGEIETEGLGIMALDMGYAPFGMPNLEIRHRNR